MGLFQHYSIMVNPEDTSYGCLSCHDGTIASSVGICTVDCTVSDSHPVEKEYPPLGREAKFASIDNVVAAGIKLLDNKIGCISCHDITNQSESHLRIPNENSGLCTVCHIQ
ncbi:MAG: cytochrome C [Geobacter sp.]|nr:cytochrome C [Geobacter sp.]